MAIPTTADWNLSKTNVDAWDGVVNGGVNDTVTLTDLTVVKSLRNILTTFQAFNPIGAWVTSTAYVVKDLVKESGTWYLVLEDHTSGVFATDLAAGKLQIYQFDFSSPVFFTDDFTVDTDTFYVDSSNNRVGVGNTLPLTTLDIHKDDRTNGPILRLTNSANGGSYAAGEIIGQIEFYSSDLSAPRVSTKIVSIIENISLDDQPSKIGLSFFTRNTTTFTEKMRITNEGLVGIGTTAPTTALDVTRNVNSDQGISINNQFGGYASFISTNANSDYSFIKHTNSSSGQEWFSGMRGSQDWVVYDGNSSKTRIRVADITGYISMGNNSDESIYPFQLNSSRTDATYVSNDLSTWVDFTIEAETATGNARGILFDFDGDGGGVRGAGIVGISGDPGGGVGSLGFITTAGNVSSEIMRISTNGNVGISVTSPDEKLDVDGRISITDGVGEPSTHAGKATIYVDTADGDFKIKFGDGTVKTISTDT